MDDLDPKRAKVRGAEPTGARGHRKRGDRRRSLTRSINRIGDVQLGRHPIDFLQLLVVPLLIIGIWQAFFQTSDLGKALQRARTAPVAETADLAGAEPGTDAVLGGRLGVASNVFFPVDPAAAAYRLVLYKRERWECEEDSDGDYKGTWRFSAYVAPDVIALNGREIAIRLDRPMSMSGDLFTSPTVEEGWGWRCDGRREGSIRFVGYYDGDSICVFGRTGSAGVLVVERLHGGDCESFIAHLEERAKGARKAGSIFLGIALLIEVVWLGIRVLPRLARRQR